MEELHLEQLHEVTIRACDGLAGCSPSAIEMASFLNLYDKIKTSDIQESVINAAASLITESEPNYQYAAGRLVSYALYREVFGHGDRSSLKDLVDANVKAGFYDPELPEMYSNEEWAKMDGWLDHGRDDAFTYAAMQMWRTKYLVRDRIHSKIIETPQYAYMLIAAEFFHAYPKETRMQYVHRFYDAVSQFVISLPTPIMAGLRTPDKQFSSCLLIEADDSLESIFSVAHAVGLNVAHRAGIGINGGRVRAIGSKIRSGEAYSTGVIPFFRVWESSIRSCSQGGLRNGAGTVYVCGYHYEIEDVLVLKNNKGTEENRLRNVDWCVQINRLFYERLIEGGSITLFDPHEVPELYEPFFTDQAKFKELYEKAERKTSIRKKTIKAIDFFQRIILERKATGRLYVQNVDVLNAHSSFIPEVAPIRQSNLCCEISLPVKPLRTLSDPDSEIAMCILGAVNLGKMKSADDFREPCELIVRALDELIDFQHYILQASARSATKRRTIGVGVTNLAYWLAKRGLTYQDIDAVGLAQVDEMMEAFNFHMIRASVDLAKEKGACEKFNETKWSQGLMTHDTRKPDVDELTPMVERLDWDSLRKDLAEYGIRNSTLIAQMPVESSSLISNSTNGIEPPRAIVSYKQSKDGVVAQVVPEPRRLKNKYDLLWNQKSPHGYIKIAAVMQKWIDQAMSINTSYNPALYPNGEVPMSEAIKDLVMCYRLGIPDLYYANFYDGATDESADDGKEPGNTDNPKSQDVDEECESCKL